MKHEIQFDLFSVNEHLFCSEVCREVWTKALLQNAFQTCLNDSVSFISPLITFKFWYNWLFNMPDIQSEREVSLSLACKWWQNVSISVQCYTFLACTPLLLPRLAGFSQSRHFSSRPTFLAVDIKLLSKSRVLCCLIY